MIDFNGRTDAEHEDAIAEAHAVCETCDDTGCLAACCSNPLVVVAEGRGWALYAHEGKCESAWKEAA